MKDIQTLIEQQQKPGEKINQLRSRAQGCLDKIEECKNAQKRGELETKKIRGELATKEKRLKESEENLEKLNAKHTTQQRDLDNADYRQLVVDMEKTAISVVDKSLEKTRTTIAQKDQGKENKGKIRDLCNAIHTSEENFYQGRCEEIVNEINVLTSTHNKLAPGKTKVAFKIFSITYNQITSLFTTHKELKSSAGKTKLENEIAKKESDIEKSRADLEGLQKKLNDQSIESESIIEKQNQQLKQINQELAELQEEQDQSSQEIGKLEQTINSYDQHSKIADQNLAQLRNLTTPTDQNGYSLEIHQLDVGQGESALIICRKGAAVKWSVLLDAGENCNENPDHIAGYVQKYIGNNAKLDAFIISHEDKDHHGDVVKSFIENKKHSLDSVINYREGEKTLFITQDSSFRFSLNNEKPEKINENKDSILNKNIWELLGKNKPDGKVPNMICIAHNAKVKGKKGDRDLTKFLPKNDKNKNESEEDKIKKEEKSKNERSLGFLIEFGGFKFYTAADLSSQIEDQINIGRVSAFKAGHHGSKFSTSGGLISNLQPRATIISHGNKVFGEEAHPNRTALENVAEDDQLQVAYLTNPTTRDKTKNEDTTNFISENKKFVIAGRRTVLHKKNQDKSPRGDVFFRITQSQAEQKDVFFVDYEQDYEDKKNHKKKRQLVDHFTDIEPTRLEKIIPETLNKSVAVESSHSMSLKDIQQDEEGKTWTGTLNNQAGNSLKMSGHYRTKDKEYQTGSGKEKTSNEDRLVLKSTDASFDVHRKFLKASNPEGYEELMKSLPEEKRNDIELYKNYTASKLKLKASNDGDTSLSLSWVQATQKHKIKIKTLLDKGDAPKSFVDRISYTISQKTMR